MARCFWAETCFYCFLLLAVWVKACTSKMAAKCGLSYWLVFFARSFWPVFTVQRSHRVHAADPLLHRNAYAITSTEVWGIWKKIYTSCATMPRLITLRALRWRFSFIWEINKCSSLMFAEVNGWRSTLRACVCVCVYLQPQIYEDSIVIKSVFESARQRIVTNEQQKKTVTTSHSDNGGEAEDQFTPSAGERQWTKARRRKKQKEGGKYCKVVFKMIVLWFCISLDFFSFFVTRETATRPDKESKWGEKQKSHRHEASHSFRQR